MIRSILHEEVQFYPIETLRVSPDNILTDGSLIHQAVTTHFQEWYRAPPVLDHVEAWWLHRDQQEFLGVGRQTAIPDLFFRYYELGSSMSPVVRSLRLSLIGSFPPPRP